MDIKKLEKFLEDHNQPKFRLKQILKAVYQDGVSSFSEITTLPKALGHEMSKLEILPFKAEKVLEAKPARLASLPACQAARGGQGESVAGGDGKSAKAALRLSDGNIIETVLMSPIPGSWSVCVSTQAGCPMGCAFCATGEGGFKRNLTAEEITDQVLFWKQYLKDLGSKSPSGLLEPKIGNVVYMGMGEPFLNWENVKESLEILTDKNLFGFGFRSISVSTCGIPDGIIEFAKSFPQMNLAISLHFADDEKRSKFMPANRKYNLEELKKTLQEYFTITRRKVFIEYIMLEGINDSREEAENLAGYLKGVGETQLLHVNLIQYNSATKGFDPSRPKRPKGVESLYSSSNNKTHAFKNYLLQNNINVTIRQSLGEEIQGACGQLIGTV